MLEIGEMDNTNKNWKLPRPTAFPDNWEVEDLNFVPFSEEFRSGWRAHSHLGKAYEIIEILGWDLPYELILGVGAAVSVHRRFSHFNEAVSAAQNDISNHALFCLRIRPRKEDLP
jgi:hypothetical protein